MAKEPVVVIGMGEMGSVFARGLLRLGHPVYPVGRDDNMKKLARALGTLGMELPTLSAIAAEQAQPGHT